MATSVSANQLRVVMLDPCCVTPYYVGSLCQHLMASHVAVTVASIGYHFDRSYFDRIGVRLHSGMVDMASYAPLPCSLRRVLKAAECAWNLRRLRGSMLNGQPVVAHLHQVVLAYHGGMAEIRFLDWLKAHDIPLVCTVHNVLPHDTGDRYMPIHRRLYGMADRLICHTKESAACVVEAFGICASRIWVIPHGPLSMGICLTRTQARKRMGFSATDHVVLTQGFVKPYKGVGFLLDAWPEVVRFNPRAVLVIAGTGEPGTIAGLQAQARRLSIAESVRFEPRFLQAPDLSALYEAADVLVYPYKSITTSGALMTGVSFAKPIVATKLPAFCEILHDGEDARLIDYGDCQSLARVIRELLTDSEQRERLGHAASQLTKGDLSWASIAARTIECYKDAVSNHR